MKSVLRRLSHWGWDAIYGVETRFHVPTAEPHAIHYEPTSPRLARQLLRTLRWPYEESTFVDVGAGKGRVLMVAAGFPFRRVVGIEHSADLVATAQENLRRYRGRQVCSSVECVCVDARNFSWPPGRLVLFFFNPFDETVMSLVAESLRRSLASDPRPIAILCAGRWTTTVPLQRLPGVRQIAAGTQYHIYVAEA